MPMLRDAVVQAADRSEVREAVLRVYAALQLEIDSRRPRCDASGRCCRFEEFGHRLYVTTAELATFLHDLPPEAVAPAEQNPSGCRFQVGGLCSVHTIRPFGCRIFFCDPTAGEWQQVQYERFHGDLKRIHDELGVPYFYVEWRAGLAEIALGGELPPQAGDKRLSLPQLRL